MGAAVRRAGGAGRPGTGGVRRSADVRGAGRRPGSGALSGGCSGSAAALHTGGDGAPGPGRGVRERRPEGRAGRRECHPRHTRGRARVRRAVGGVAGPGQLRAAAGRAERHHGRGAARAAVPARCTGQGAAAGRVRGAGRGGRGAVRRCRGGTHRAVPGVVRADGTGSRGSCGSRTAGLDTRVRLGERLLPGSLLVGGPAADAVRAGSGAAGGRQRGVGAGAGGCGSPACGAGPGCARPHGHTRGDPS